MYFSFHKYEAHLFKCPLQSGFYKWPRIYKVTREYGYDIHFSWLGGCCVGSKINKTR